MLRKDQSNVSQVLSSYYLVVVMEQTVVLCFYVYLLRITRTWIRTVSRLRKLRIDDLNQKKLQLFQR